MRTTGWLIFIGAIGMMAGMVAVDVTTLMAWSDALRPAFVGSTLGHFSAVIAAFVGGKIIPDDRNPFSRTRATDPK